MKTKKNLYLFQPNFKVGEGNFAGYWLPYSVACLWAYAEQFEAISDNYRLTEVVFRRDEPDNVLARVEVPAVLAFSAYIWNWNWCCETARKARAAFPDALILFGGPQVPERGEDFFQRHPYVDVAVVGEGEHAFAHILSEALEPSPDFTKVSGCLVRSKDCAAVRTPPRVRSDLENFPSPYQTGFFDEILRHNPGLNWNTTLETNRGCPFRCTFCDWGSLTYAKIKSFELGRVHDDLDWIAANRMDYVFVADPNFGVFEQRDEQIIDYMINVRKEVGYPKTVNVQWYKNSNPTIVSMAKRLTDAGLNRAITLSVQSMSPKVLAAIERQNLAFSRLRDLLEICARENIPSYTELILGLPEETFDSWADGLHQLLELGQHSVIDVWLCELLENAELNSPKTKEKFAIESRMVGDYFETSKDEPIDIPETIELIYSTSSMQHSELIRSYMYAWLVMNLHCFGWTQFIARFLRKHAGLSYAAFYKHLFDFLTQDKSGVLGGELADSESIVREHYAGSAPTRVDPYSGRVLNAKAALWKTQFAIHCQREDVFGEIESFIESLDLDVDRTLLREASRFQREFVSDVDASYPREETFEYNFLEFLLCDDELEPGSHTYTFDLREPYEDREDYLVKLYYRRRQGWGKTRIQNVNCDTVPVVGDDKVPIAQLTNATPVPIGTGEVY